MKEFLVYTGLRLVSLIGAVIIVGGIWIASTGGSLTYDEVFWIFVVAFVVSGVVSYFLLNPFREALARKVQVRADRATARLEEIRAKEDQ